MTHTDPTPAIPPLPAPPPLVPGTLYLVATPIGNLEDITLRAIRTLRDVDIVAAEDTRHTGRLLQHLGFRKRLVSCFQHNERHRATTILDALARGEKVALVTDAGTPGISDPGERVARLAIEAGHRVEAVPGPCALVAGLTASGLPTGEFHFIGFLPHKSGQRRKELERLRALPGTLVLYESPHRIERLLRELTETMPARRVVVGRELTKKFEEFRRGTAGEVLATHAKHPIRGECVVIVGPEGDAPDDSDRTLPDAEANAGWTDPSPRPTNASPTSPL